jgi:hypothetical protein
MFTKALTSNPQLRLIAVLPLFPDQDQGSGHCARQAGSLDRLTWLFVAMGRLLLALGASKLM